MATGAIAAIGVAAINATPVGAPTLRLSLAISLGILFTLSFWFVADSMRPWLVDEASLTLEDRTHADRALRDSYVMLLRVAISAVVYLYLSDGEAAVIPDVPRDGKLLLWSFVALVFLLPIGFSAWNEPDNAAGGAVVGPLAFTRSRFRGRSGPVYAVGALSLVAIVPLLLGGLVRIRGGSSAWLNAAVAFGLMVILGAIIMFVRDLAAEHGAGRSRRQP